MAKKNTPLITHTEILCLAIRNLEQELKTKTQYYEGIPECQTFLEAALKELTPKLEALKEMYRIETGTDYD